MVLPLYPNRERFASYAAVAASLAHRAGGPGLVVDRTALRGCNNHPNNRHYATVLLQRGTLVFVGFPDNSVLIGFDIGQNQLALHPMIYRLASLEGAHGMVVIKRGTNPLHSTLETPLYARLVHTYRDTTAQGTEHTLPTTPAWHAWLDALFAQLADLLAAPLPMVGVPSPAVSQPITPALCADLGLPASALGSPLVVPDWMPQQSLSAEDIAALQSTLQAILDWIVFTQGPQGANRITDAGMVVYANTGAQQAERSVVREDWRMLISINRNPATLTSGMVRQVYSPIKSFFADPTRIPALPRNPIGFSFGAMTNTFTVQVKPDMLFAGYSIDTISAHRGVALMGRFGAPATLG